MKIKNYQLRFFLLFSIFFSFTLTSCSTKMKFVTSPVVPAAEGSVKIKKDDNGNNTIELNVKRLTNPSRLQPAKKTYVVWMETESNGVKNIGQLLSTSSIFSSELRGSLTTVTPYKPKKFYISAENDGTVRYPGTLIVLTTAY